MYRYFQSHTNSAAAPSQPCKRLYTATHNYCHSAWFGISILPKREVIVKGDKVTQNEKS